MASAFNKMLANTRDRNWGGTWEGIAAEPYISGYAYVAWYLPEALEKYLEANSKYVEETAKQTNEITKTETKCGYDGGASQTLESACTGVTPPGGTLNKAEFQGLGGVKWSVPTNIDYGNSISLKYVEFSGLPILRIHRAWVNMIRDNKSGLTGLWTERSGDVYNKQHYAANLLYWTTKPDGVTVEYYAAYSGVFPTKDPQDLFNGDITSIDKLEIEIDYNVDMIWHEDWVYKLAAKEAQARAYGAKGKTLWNSNGIGSGYRYGEGVQSTDFANTPQHI